MRDKLKSKYPNLNDCSVLLTSGDEWRCAAKAKYWNSIEKQCFLYRASKGKVRTRWKGGCIVIFEKLWLAPRLTDVKVCAFSSLSFRWDMKADTIRLNQVPSNVTRLQVCNDSRENIQDNLQLKDSVQQANIYRYLAVKTLSISVSTHPSCPLCCSFLIKYWTKYCNMPEPKKFSSFWCFESLNYFFFKWNMKKVLEFSTFKTLQ